MNFTWEEKYVLISHVTEEKFLLFVCYGADISNISLSLIQQKLNYTGIKWDHAWVLINLPFKNKSAQKKSHIKNLHNSIEHLKLLLKHYDSEAQLWILSLQSLPLLSIRSYTDKFWAHHQSQEFLYPVQSDRSVPSSLLLPTKTQSTNAVESVWCSAMGRNEASLVSVPVS